MIILKTPLDDPRLVEAARQLRTDLQPTAYLWDHEGNLKAVQISPEAWRRLGAFVAECSILVEEWMVNESGEVGHADS